MLKKADPKRLATSVERIRELFEQVCRLESRLVYIGEAHFNRVIGLAYTWAEKNKIAWRKCKCTPLKARINWNGI